MQFRPCIDIHGGKVKQIVGGSLTDAGDRASENFATEEEADSFARLFSKWNLPGGHVILLNPASSPYYEANLAQAKKALRAYPGGLMAGGGITPENAHLFLDAGASHVIVTSYAFQDGRIVYDHLAKIVRCVGQKRLVLDLSCRRKEDGFYIVTDRWQRFTEVKLTPSLLSELTAYCDEFLVHGVDVEGKSAGADEELLMLLTSVKGFPVTYAGGIASLEEIAKIKTVTGGAIDVTIGSALSIYGGPLSFEDVVRAVRK